MQKKMENFSLVDGLLFYFKRLCVPSYLRINILQEAHKGPLASHPGYQKTYENLMKSFYWRHMKKKALEFTRRCLICQKIKAERVKLLGLLQPLDILEMK